MAACARFARPAPWCSLDQGKSPKVRAEIEKAGVARSTPLPGKPGGSPKSGRRDLNPRPLRPERSALPNCATSR